MFLKCAILLKDGDVSRAEGKNLYWEWPIDMELGTIKFYADNPIEPGNWLMVAQFKATDVIGVTYMLEEDIYGEDSDLERESYMITQRMAFKGATADEIDIVMKLFDKYIRGKKEESDDGSADTK